METILNEYEVRVLGALIEKKITTPEYYPLTLNAIINACNQKSSRDPVVSYDESIVQKALTSLREKKLVYVFSGADARVAKYGHLFPEAMDLSHAETAIMCVLMLRGAQTPGELRTRTASLYNFDSLVDVELALQSLMDDDIRKDPLVVKLPRQPGTKESRYAHLLSGEVNLEQLPVIAAPRPTSSSSAAAVNAERLATLEAEVASLKEQLTALQQQFVEFKKQFE
ncbi:MAG TPA: YceH family protein [Blastocatellia bacterium]|nr:YceH family protein [Blastocatellia bacterium]